jgi:hypothetical protein
VKFARNALQGFHGSAWMEFHSIRLANLISIPLVAPAIVLLCADRGHPSKSWWRSEDRSAGLRAVSWKIKIRLSSLVFGDFHRSSTPNIRQFRKPMANSPGKKFCQNRSSD